MKELQKIYVNPASNNSEILTIQIWHLRSPKAEFFYFYKQKAPSSKQADIRDKFTKVYKSVCTSTVAVTPDPLSPAPSTSSAARTPENSDKDPDDLEPADEGDIQMEYCCGYWYSSNIGAVTQLPVRTYGRSVQIIYENPEYPITWHLYNRM
jgi:hypothetical protein